ncbi:hypothetical protein [Streptomyces europaeiscabiei]|uniref:hypothetical protein n=1 Tax=Streptomyces europaeiscabiei TaxID=146819 RepID=UPI002E28252E|nr:hypothetical protein [Streptomyces europaeiscabiei]
MAAMAESDAADAGVVRVREAFGVAEALEFGDCFRGAPLGHAELLGQVADGGPGVEEALEDIAVGHAQNAVAADAQVALEVTWSGTLAVSLGDLTAGQVLRARIAAFLEFRDGKIIAQRNYDCYERLRPAAPSETDRQGEGGKSSR